MKEPFFSRDLQSRLEQMSAGTFWALVFFIWLFSQFPAIGLPFRFIATWVHELGHGLGALISGGKFDEMKVLPNLSGLASIRVSSPGDHMIALLTGLLAPSIAGGIMLFMTRAMGAGRLALMGLASLLLLSSGIWAGDMFTLIILLAIGGLIAFLVIKGGEFITQLVSYFIAITLCLNVLVDVQYFFMQSGVIDGMSLGSDTSKLAEITGLPHMIWAVLVTALSFLILYLSFRLSGVLGSRR